MTTIRGRLTRNVLLAFSLPAIAGAVGVYMLVRQQLVAQFDRALSAKALAIAATTRRAGDDISIDESARLLSEFDESDHPGAAATGHEHPSEDSRAASFFQILRPDGTTLRRSKLLAHTNLVAPNALGKGPRFWDLALPTGRAGRAIGISFWPELSDEQDGRNERNLPRLTLIVAVEREAIDETLSTLAMVLGGASLVLVAATFLVVPRLVERGFVPLRELGEKATHITSDSLGIRFAVAGMPDELAPIAERLNDLLARLERSFQRERQFSADVAHELRTPIAELRSLVEVSMKWPDRGPRETDRDAHAIALQMEGLVTRLLALVRSERGQLVITPSAIQLPELVSESWRPFDHRARDRGLHVTHQPSGEFAVMTDPVLLRSILSNLFDNAVDYTPPQGAIDVQVADDEASYMVRVTNDCSNLQADDVAMLFSRFWRHDSARSGGDHNGLGLSLARAFARDLGGDLVARLEPGRLTMTLKGPLALDRSRG